MQECHRKIIHVHTKSAIQLTSVGLALVHTITKCKTKISSALLVCPFCGKLCLVGYWCNWVCCLQIFFLSAKTFNSSMLVK